MARKARVKRKAVKPAAQSRAERQPFSFMLPPDLVAAVDAIASDERRSRVRTVEIMLTEAVQSYQRRTAV